MTDKETTVYDIAKNIGISHEDAETDSNAALKMALRLIMEPGYGRSDALKEINDLPMSTERKTFISLVLGEGLEKTTKLFSAASSLIDTGGKMKSRGGMHMISSDDLPDDILDALTKHLKKKSEAGGDEADDTTPKEEPVYYR